ncbi:MAG: carbohydrate kinase family protein [Methanotrichaceae archaeon]|nr:carbohydrate kinase family protein [Methanotrichaceae archaeon]
MSLQESSNGHKGVLVVGGIIVDLIAKSEQFKVIDGNICFPFDSKITLQELKEDIGGSAHNVAANLAKLGTITYILGSIGKGDYGEEALKNLRIHGVNTKYVTLKEGLTGMSLVFLVNGEKTVLTSRGANGFLGEKDLNPEVFDKVDMLILTSLVSSDNIDLMKNAIEEAKKRNVSIVTNPSISMVTQRSDELKYAMQNSKVIIMNGKESCLITGGKDVESAIKELKKYGAETVIVTQDVKGSLVAENGEIFRVPSYKVKVVDTTGGGDSYTAGFIHAKFGGYSTKEAVEFASAVAALNITTPGASTDLPTEKEVIEFMKTAKYLE